MSFSRLRLILCMWSAISIAMIFTRTINAAPPSGQRMDLSDLQGVWSVEEHFPKIVGSNDSNSLACSEVRDVTYDIRGGIWRRTSSIADRFNSNGKYYILNVVRGNELTYVKFRVYADLTDEEQPCIGYIREGRIIRMQMNTTSPKHCPNAPDEYAGICNKWSFFTATCKSGKCMNSNQDTSYQGPVVGNNPTLSATTGANVK
ncbi:hypothetical protein HK098_001909, partial [Nowakowskiella sp. JEL0407]